MTEGGDFARAARQEQFLEVASVGDAHARWRRHLRLDPLPPEPVPLADALGRVLAADLPAPADAPPFDRASVDGFAVRAADTAHASPEAPRGLRLLPEVLTPGVVPRLEVGPGAAVTVATGAMLPRGADAVVMVERTEVRDGPDGAARVEVAAAVTPGAAVAAAGGDIARGETVLRQGAVIGSREVAMLAAVGLAEVGVRRRPRVAVLSTGDEIVAPGAPLRPGQVYDSNGAVLAAAVTEAGCTPVPLGIVRDDEGALRAALAGAIEGGADLVLLSGGTSKGVGDLAARAIAHLGPPGVVVHGVALKPGKPVCLAVAAGGTPVVALPGFPTSAVVTFHEFVAPVLRALAGRAEPEAATVGATLPVRLASERGRAEHAMVALVRGEGDALLAYPLAKGSGAVTAFSRADGFVTVEAEREAVPAGTAVTVRLLGGAGARVPDLVAIGSHCVGLDLLLGRLAREGLAVRSIHVGSLGGLAAARRGECDVAGVHLLDPATGLYNRPFLDDSLDLIPGYGRLQGVLHRRGDPRFAGARDAREAVDRACADPACLMLHRNAGSGTRILTDGILGERRPEGFRTQARSHHAVAAAVAQGRADWGVAIAPVAEAYGLAFLPLAAERYDLAVPRARAERPAVRRLRELLGDGSVRAELRGLGFEA